MKRDDKNDLFFKNLASAYAEKVGNESEKELDSLDSTEYSSSLDAKLKNRLNKNKFRKLSAWMLPLSACFIIFILYYAVLSPKHDADSFESPRNILNYEFISEKLPENYTLVKMDYDNQKVIYYISAGKDNEVILTVEERTEDMPTEGLNKIQINDTDVYADVKHEYSLLKYEKNNLLYTLTGQYGLEDLIRISENLI